MIGTQDDICNFFDGAIDDVEIFNEALSPQEITLDRYLGIQCLADLDDNGVVENADLGVFAGNLGNTACTGQPECRGDLSGDGDVDGDDLARFIVEFERPEVRHALTYSNPAASS